MQNFNNVKSFLKKNNNIFFTLADKISAAVCINKDTYINKAEALLSDTYAYI